jgi:hypothetical protein
VTRAELIQLDRETLLVRAEQLGVPSVRTLTRPELVDEILLRTAEDPQSVRLARGFFGLARDLLARVVQRGLHLPDAVERIRGVAPPPPPRQAGPAIPTITLAEIYAAQGHIARAVATLRALIELDPGNDAARARLVTLTASEGERGFGRPELGGHVASSSASPASSPDAQGNEAVEPWMLATDVAGSVSHDAAEDDDLPRPLDPNALAEHLRSSGAALALQLRNPRRDVASPSHVVAQVHANTNSVVGDTPMFEAGVDLAPAALAAPTAVPADLADRPVSDANIDDRGVNAVDENAYCQSLQLSPGVWHLSWSIGSAVAPEPTSVAQWSLVVLTVLPGWRGSEVRQAVHPLASARGFLVLRDVERNAVLRLMLGRQTAHGIEVVAIGRAGVATTIDRASLAVERSHVVSTDTSAHESAAAVRRAYAVEFANRSVDIHRE